jgi:hypothetical protein
MAETPWARVRGLGGQDALVAYLAARIEIEHRLRATIPVTWTELQSPAGGSADWVGFYADLAALVDRLVHPG